MHLDSTTVIATGAFVAGMSGAFMLVAGGKLNQARPTSIWGVANLLIAIGMLLVVQGADHALAYLSTIAAGVLCWTAMVRFNGERPPSTYPVAALAVWTILVLGPWEVPFGVCASILLLTAAAFFGATARELWRGRAETLPGRWPILMLVAMKTTGLVMGAAAIAPLTAQPAQPLDALLWVYYLSTVAFTVGTSMFFVAMTKERAAVDNELAAVTDSLTGLANRGALMVSADQVINETIAGGLPIAVAVFDLDHFKRVNDTYGHRAGDAVLCHFAERAIANMRSTDLIGRVGGEEFAAVIPGANSSAAMDFAERVRIAFSADPVVVNGREIVATVSSGVAVAEPDGTEHRLEEILDRADIALYAAKTAGRDRVALSPPSTVDDPESDASLEVALRSVALSA